MRIISWARGAGLTTYRPPEQIERRYYGDRSDLIWEDATHIAPFMDVVPKPLQWALTLAVKTGLRHGDILVLSWSAYDPTPTEHDPLGWIRRTPRRRPSPTSARRDAVSRSPSRGAYERCSTPFRAWE